MQPTARHFCTPVLLSFCFSPGSCPRPHPAPASVVSPVIPEVLLCSGCGVTDLPPRPKNHPALLVVHSDTLVCAESRDPFTKAPVLSPVPSIPGPFSSICSSYHLLARSFVSRKQEHSGRNASCGPGTDRWMDRQKETPGSLLCRSLSRNWGVRSWSLSRNRGAGSWSPSAC